MSSRFFSNTACEYFPCHAGIAPAQFNCLFCYCPLYSYPACPGQKQITDSGLKDCSRCRLPHLGERGYTRVLAALPKAT